MSRPLPQDFDVDYEVTRLLRRVRMRTMGRLSQIHDDLDYNTFVLFVAVADADGGIRASDLADTLHVHKSTISRAVASLERMGLVVRTPDPADGRAQLLTAPDSARTQLDEFRRVSHDYLASLLTDWEPHELRTFAGLLARLNDAAEQVTSQPSTPKGGAAP